MLLHQDHITLKTIRRYLNVQGGDEKKIFRYSGTLYNIFTDINNACQFYVIIYSTKCLRLGVSHFLVICKINVKRILDLKPCRFLKSLIFLGFYMFYSL